MSAWALCWPQVAQVTGERQDRNILDLGSSLGYLPSVVLVLSAR